MDILTGTATLREGLDFEGPAFEIKEAGRLLSITLSSTGIASILETVLEDIVAARVLGTEGIKGVSPLASIKNKAPVYVPYILEVYAIITAS